MVQDLHSHTYYSFCGADQPDAVIEAAIEGGIEILGISDHNYGIGFQHPSIKFESEKERIRLYQTKLRQYYDHINTLADGYREKIKLVCGIEICTVDVGYTLLPDGVDVSMFEYCLIENLDAADTKMGDLFAFAERCGCKYKGIAHTNLPAYLKKNQIDMFDFFHRMAESNIFWELNVNYDSIHRFREHEYVKEFFEDPELIDIVRQSGVCLSVGFDGHRVAEYKPERIVEACRNLERLNIPMVEIV